MKAKRYPQHSAKILELNDKSEPAAESGLEAMVRTQVYLTRSEHEYLSREAARKGEGLSTVLRSIIEEKMKIPEEAWTNNPMLEPTPDVPGWQGHEDGALNHDHYAYGGPKKYEKINGQWALLPPIDE